MTRHVSVLLSFVGLSATVFVVWIYILVSDVSFDRRRSVELVTFMVDVVLSCFEQVFEHQISNATYTCRLDFGLSAIYHATVHC